MSLKLAQLLVQLCLLSCLTLKTCSGNLNVYFSSSFLSSSPSSLIITMECPVECDRTCSSTTSCFSSSFSRSCSSSRCCCSSIWLPSQESRPSSLTSMRNSPLVDETTTLPGLRVWSGAESRSLRQTGQVL